MESERLRVLLDHPNERILLRRVTPDAMDDGVALVGRFHRALAAYRNAEPEAAKRVVDPGALEGYRRCGSLAKIRPEEQKEGK